MADEVPTEDMPNMLAQITDIVEKMQERFTQMSEEMIAKIDKMNERIETIESSLSSLNDELTDGQMATSSSSNNDKQ